MFPIKNRLYDRLKWLALVFLPALAVLVAGMGQVLAWSQVDRYVSIINLWTVFLGALLQVSSNHYHGGGGGNYGQRPSFA